MIDLRSDTVTLPTSAMKEAMMNAKVGDDVFEEDPTVNQLQETIAQLFRKEAALFCPSGTMCNQLAIACQTQALDEIIVDKLSHIYGYETTGYAHNSRVAIKLVEGKQGIIQLDDLNNCINGDFDWLAHTALLSIENTCNKGGGSFYSFPQMAALSKFCKDNNLAYHLDGARLFNAIVESGDQPSDIGPLFDSISICFSKGLGAPVGSILLGEKKLIKKARRFRKVMGGGMRQVGYLAAACQFAMENNVDRLKEDHDRAKKLAEHLTTLSYVESVQPVQTNIVIFRINNAIQMNEYIDALKSNGVLAIPFGEKDVRLVTHLDFTENDLDKVLTALTISAR